MAVDPDTGTFEGIVRGLKKNSTITAQVIGDDSVLTSSQSVNVKVAASISVKSSAASVKTGKLVTLTATTAPADANGSVVFEYLKAGHWTLIATKALTGTATTTTTWKVPKGTWSVRARYVPGTSNAAATSRNITVAGK